MKQFLLFYALLAIGGIAIGQNNYKTAEGKINFNASTPLEDIDANNTRVNAILVPNNGDFAVVMLIKDFKFRRKLMQEHFNENYMESETYPKAYFRGKIKDFSFNALGTTPARYPVEGELTIHGIKRSHTTTAELSLDGNAVRLKSNFIIAPESFDIEVPKILFTKIAREVKVEVDLVLQPSPSPSG